MKLNFLIPFLLVAATAVAQRPTTVTYIRGLQYTDHSANATMSPSQIVDGGTIAIQVSSLNFTKLNSLGYRFSVVLQDEARTAGAGVTVFSLRSIRIRGNMIYADVSYDIMYERILKNRNFLVTVFCNGPQPWHYVYAGRLSLR
jgi:hypothetical protein